MTTSYCLSSTRNTITPEAFLLHNSHLYVPRYCSSLITHETHLPKKEILTFKPHPFPKSSLSLIRPKTSKFLHPFAALSSFAEAEGEEGEEIKAKEHQEDAKSEDDLPGMAQAFHISSSTASAISICIAVAALTLPFFMKSLGQGLGLKIKFLSYATLLFGFYMAWNIGANDVANAMGTSVGSGALSLRQAVLTAAVLEFSGALLMGTHVTNTMQKGILVANVFQGKDTLLFAGLLSSLAAAGTWLQVASSYGWPVSTTHCIVGSMVGFGLVYGGTGAVFWSSGDITFSGSNGVVSCLQIHPQVCLQCSKPRTSSSCCCTNCRFCGCYQHLFCSISS
uniref:Phosphate transporter n=1 Tax=Davidia involucrata TaxID=16924 RepID=A0A5B7AUJ7_DAVIN